jgi:hypothetical protein
MKTILRIVLVGFLVVFFAELSFADEYNFRKTKWGMSIEQVKLSESIDIAEEAENILDYKNSVIGKDVFVSYIFIDNQLVRARYALADSHSNKNDFIIDYNDFKEILIKKDGPPEKDDSFWKNDLFEYDHSKWGTAISSGHLMYISEWETEDTTILNALMGENYKISCVVEYRSKNLENLEKKAKEKKAMEAF